MNDRIADLHQDMIAWRHDLHAHPELGFQEHRTAAFVAAKLKEFGVEVHRGIAGTGVVGTLRVGSGKRAIAFRADMDGGGSPARVGRDGRGAARSDPHACQYRWRWGLVRACDGGDRARSQAHAASGVAPEWSQRVRTSPLTRRSPVGL